MDPLPPSCGLIDRQLLTPSSLKPVPYVLGCPWQDLAIRPLLHEILNLILQYYVRWSLRCWQYFRVEYEIGHFTILFAKVLLQYNAQLQSITNVSFYHTKTVYFDRSNTNNVSYQTFKWNCIFDVVEHTINYISSINHYPSMKWTGILIECVLVHAHELVKIGYQLLPHWQKKDVQCHLWQHRLQKWDSWRHY